MRRMLLSFFLAGLSAYSADDVSFEVASVKSVERPGPRESRLCTGGPGTANPGTWSCRHVTLSYLIFNAYDLQLYQFQSPEWIQATWLSVVAKVPAGTTKTQLRQMQQNLLEERFKLAFHRQPKEMTVYELVVGKNGIKMRESAPDAPPAEVEWSIVPHFSLGQYRYPVFPDGARGLMGVNGRKLWRSSNVTMADIVRVLRQDMRTDVVDLTGLNGKFDIDMYWQEQPIESFPAAPPFQGPAIEKAIQDRLGLRLESKKGMVGVVVIDHIERTPVEN